MQAEEPEKPKATTFEKPIHLFTRSPKIFVEGMKVAFDQVKNMYGDIYFSTGDGVEIMGLSGVKGGIKKDREGTSNSIIDMEDFLIPGGGGAPVDEVKVVGPLKEGLGFIDPMINLNQHFNEPPENKNPYENVKSAPKLQESGRDTIIHEGQKIERTFEEHDYGTTTKARPIS